MMAHGFLLSFVKLVWGLGFLLFLFGNNCFWHVFTWMALTMLCNKFGFSWVCCFMSIQWHIVALWLANWWKLVVLPLTSWQAVLRTEFYVCTSPSSVSVHDMLVSGVL